MISLIMLTYSLPRDDWIRSCAWHDFQYHKRRVGPLDVQRRYWDHSTVARAGDFPAPSLETLYAKVLFHTTVSCASKWPDQPVRSSEVYEHIIKAACVLIGRCVVNESCIYAQHDARAQNADPG